MTTTVPKLRGNKGSRAAANQTCTGATTTTTIHPRTEASEAIPASAIRHDCPLLNGHVPIYKTVPIFSFMAPRSLGTCHDNQPSAATPRRWRSWGRGRGGWIAIAGALVERGVTHPLLFDEGRGGFAYEALENAQLGAHADEDVVDERAVVLDVLIPHHAQRRPLPHAKYPVRRRAHGREGEEGVRAAHLHRALMRLPTPASAKRPQSRAPLEQVGATPGRKGAGTLPSAEGLHQQPLKPVSCVSLFICDWRPPFVQKLHVN